MNRASFILGVALLVVAITLAATITMRNAPETAETGRDSGPELVEPLQHQAYPGKTSASFDPVAAPDRKHARNHNSRESFRVRIPTAQLSLLPEEERASLVQRAGAVELQARGRLERMTAELDLSGEQRRKMFPLLVQSSSGFDPLMQVGGNYLGAAPGTTAVPDEIHQKLDPEQQEAYEDAELDHQLWWEEVFARLEDDLLGSTGATVAPPAVEPPDPPATPAEQPESPAPRTGGNLFDLLGN